MIAADTAITWAIAMVLWALVFIIILTPIIHGIGALCYFLLKFFGYYDRKKKKKDNNLT